MKNNHALVARIFAVGGMLTFATMILIGCRDQSSILAPPISQSPETVATDITLSPTAILGIAAPLHSPPVPTAIPVTATQARTSNEGKLAALVERNPAYSTAADLYLVDSQTGEATRLTEGMSVNMLSWSPDGKQIAFSALAPEYFSYEIFVADTVSKGIRHLEIPLVGGANRDEVSWSPNGDRLAFVQRVADDGHIYTMKVDGTDIKYLTEGNRPSWSPDGKYITFVRPRRPGTYGDIFVVDSEGKNLKQLTYDVEADGPIWSPDGNYVAFAGFWLGKDDLATGYYIMNPDGTGLTFLSRRGDSFPSWSQDGQRILFTERGRVYAIDISNLEVLPVDGLAPDLYYVFVLPAPQ